MCALLACAVGTGSAVAQSNGGSSSSSPTVTGSTSDQGSGGGAQSGMTGQGGNQGPGYGQQGFAQQQPQQQQSGQGYGFQPGYGGNMMGYGYGPGMMGYGHPYGMMGQGYGHPYGMMGYGYGPGMMGYGQPNMGQGYGRWQQGQGQFQRQGQPSGQQTGSLTMQQQGQGANQGGNRGGPLIGWFAYTQRPGGLNGQGMLDRVEGRLAFIKAELKITNDQNQAWSQLAQAVRSVAKSRNQRVQQILSGEHANESLIQRLNLQQQLLSARLQEVKELQSAWSQLYSDLSPSQKQAANNIVLPMMGFS